MPAPWFGEIAENGVPHTKRQPTGFSLCDTAYVRLEHTSIRRHPSGSGIVRVLDLALGTQVGAASTLFLVAPDNRRDVVAQQLKRPVFSRVSELGIRYLPYNQLKEHRETIGRFGPSIKPLMEISQLL